MATSFASVTGNWIKQESVMSDTYIATFQLSAVFPSAVWFAAGRNTEGQLGVGDYVNKSGFTRIPGFWKKIIPAGPFTLGLSANSTQLYATGVLSALQANLPTQVNTFTQLTGDWVDAYGGDGYAFALSAASEYVWFTTGRNLSGQLGLGDFVDRLAFNRLTGRWQSNLSTYPADYIPTFFCGINNAFAVSANETPTGGSLWYAAGANTRGELGLGTSTNVSTFTKINDSNNYTSVRPGSGFTVALSSNASNIGRLYGTGANASGQLGFNAPYTDRTSFAVMTGTWSNVGVGIAHTVALSSHNSQLHATGFNNYGQLGLGNTTSQAAFNAVSATWAGVATGPYSSASVYLGG